MKFKAGDILKGISEGAENYPFLKNGLYKLTKVIPGHDYICIYCGRDMVDQKVVLSFVKEFNRAGVLAHVHHFVKATEREVFLYHINGRKALIK